MAFGRAIYNFLSLEETLVAVVYDAGSDPRSTNSNGTHVAPVLDAAADAFGAARSAIRNHLANSHPFTAGTGASGAHLPGLACTCGKGMREIVATSPTELLDAVEAVEDAINPLSPHAMLSAPCRLRS